MEKIIKHSAGGIVLDPKTEKILLTKKLAKKEYKARVIRSLFNLFGINQEKAIKRFKLWWFTKGKIENWHSKERTALNEIQEEWGIDPSDLILIQRLWMFKKQKKYGFKEIEMFLYTLHKEYPEVNPTDKRHIAAFIDLEKVVEYIQNKDEKEFLISIQHEIQKILKAHKKITTLPVNETVDVIEIDIGIER